MNLLETFPFPFGHEGVGRIRKVGKDVHTVKAGDLVFCAGGAANMAELINVQPDRIGLLPSDVKDFTRWVGEPVTCVVNGINQLRMAPGDRVAVVGTGYMGLLIVQGLARSLVGRIIAFDIDEKRLALAKKYGADEIHVSGTEEAAKTQESIAAAGGLDVVIEVSSSAEGLDLAQKLMKKGGTLSLFAWHRANRSFDGTLWHLGGFKILNTSPMIDPHYADMIERAAILMGRGVFFQDDLVTHHDDFKHAQELFELAVHKREGYIKGVVTF